MRNIYLCLFLGIVFGACRQDDSTFVNSNTPQESGDNRKCNTVRLATADNSQVATLKYELDSILTEVVSIEDGEVITAWYLHIENPRQFIFMDGSKTFENAKTRIYLNEDGSIAKEIAVALNPDGQTFTEIPDEANVYTYNSKKQLVKIDIGYDDDGEESEAIFTYDEKNRIQRLVIKGPDGTDYAIYDNFSYDPHAKNDNFLTFDFMESISGRFIPSLRNVYIKSYRMQIPEAPMFNTTFMFDYKFEQDKLSEITLKVTLFGLPAEEVKLGVTLDCK